MTVLNMALAINMDKRINGLTKEIDCENFLISQHNEIKVFLASSDELKLERIAFGDFIRQLSDIFEKRRLCIKLKKWEDFDAAYNGRRKQDDYNDYVRDSEMFLALFYKKAGKYTIEEFNVALKEYERTGVKPKIYVFCKNLNDGELENVDLKRFKTRLDNNLGYFWGHYNNSDSLQLNFVMQLLLFESNIVDNLKVEKGNVTLDSLPVARMDKLSFVVNNNDYQQIKRRLKELAILIENDRQEVDKHPDNKDLLDYLQGHIDEKNDLQDKLVQQQNLLFETAKRINGLQVSAITERMRKAIDAFERGDSHQASIILDGTEYDADRNLTDFIHSKALTDQSREKAILSIEELLLKASVYMGDVSVNIESRVDTVRNHYIKADDIAQKVGYEKEKHAKLLIDFVDFSLKYGLYDDAVIYGNRQIQLSEELYGDSSIKITPIYNLMGLVYCGMGNYDKALEYHIKTLRIEEKELGNNNSHTSTSYNNIGLAYHHIGDYPKALEYYKKSLEIKEDAYGKESLGVAITCNNIGDIHEKLGDIPTAIEYYTRAKDIRERTLGTNHLETAITYNSLGVLFDNQGNYAKAEEYLLKAIEIREKELGPNHPDTACSYNNLAEVYRKHRGYRKALDYYIRASDVYLKRQVSPFAIAAVLNNIGLVYYELKDCDKALKCYFGALEKYKKTLREEHDVTANVLHNIGMAYLKKGNNKDALTYLNKAKAVFLSKFGPNHPSTKKSQKWIDYAKGKM